MLNKISSGVSLDVDAEMFSWDSVATKQSLVVVGQFRGKESLGNRALLDGCTDPY